MRAFRLQTTELSLADRNRFIARFAAEPMLSVRPMVQDARRSLEVAGEAYVPRSVGEVAATLGALRLDTQLEGRPATLDLLTREGSRYALDLAFITEEARLVDLCCELASLCDATGFRVGLTAGPAVVAVVSVARLREAWALPPRDGTLLVGLSTDLAGRPGPGARDRCVGAYRVLDLRADS